VVEPGSVAVSFADEALNDGKPNYSGTYLPAAKIPPTSVKTESLFSESGYIFDDRRLGTTPEHIEQIMFLKVNRHLWDLEFVARNVVNGELCLDPVGEDALQEVSVEDSQ
jgi:hypothetical protein